MQGAKSITSSQVIEFVEQNYQLKIISEPQPVDGSIESAVFLIKTDKGSFYLKIYGLETASREAVDKEVLLYDFLISHGINVPDIFSTAKKDKVLKVILNSTEFSMFLMMQEELILKQPSELTSKETIKLGATIARMNKVLIDYPNNYTHDDKLITEDLPKDIYNTFINSANSKGYSKDELVKIGNLIRKVQEFLKAQSPNSEHLTRAMLHEDLALSHTQFLKNGEIYIFDFADMGYGPISWDLGIMIENFYRQEDISFKRWNELQTWFYEGYSKTLSLSEPDLKALKPFILQHILIAVNYLNEVAIKIKKECGPDGIRRRFELAEYLLENDLRFSKLGLK